jgi:cyclase
MDFIKRIENEGAGELMVNSVDRDGMMNGYDLQLAESIGKSISIPLIFCGGCRDFTDIIKLLSISEVSAAAAGSFFVLRGPHKGVLITYPNPSEIDEIYKY